MLDSEVKNTSRLYEQVMEEVRRHFSPEFLNRIDESIVFSQLKQPQLLQICSNLLEQLAHRLTDLNIRLECTEAALNKLCELGFSPKYGARPLRRTLQREIETPAAEMILNGTLYADTTLLCDVKEEKLTLSRKSPACLKSKPPVERVV